MENIHQRFNKLLFYFILTAVSLAVYSQQAISADTFAQKAKITSSQTWWSFGISVDIWGTTIVTGEPYLWKGFSYVFNKINDQWQQTSMLQIQPAPGYYLENSGQGSSVAISNNYMIIGGPSSDFYQQIPLGPGIFAPACGYVFILKKNTDGWDVVLDDYGSENYYLGTSVAIDGNTAVAGEPGGNDGKGSARVYVNGSYATTLIAGYGQDYEEFGCSVAVDGNTVVVGDYKHGGFGKAFVFVKPAAGWASVNPMTQTCQLFPQDKTAGDEFGCSVAVDGDTVVVGARAKDGTGAAYVFVKPENGWPDAMIHNAKLIASSQAGDNFGCSVAIQGDRVLAGATGDDIIHALPIFHINKDQGSVSLFVKPAGGWTGNINRTQLLTAANGASGDQFGASVAIDGETVVAGAPRFSSNSGSFYVFDTYSQTSTTTVSQSSTTSTAEETSTTTTADQSSTTTTADGTSTTTITDQTSTTTTIAASSTTTTSVGGPCQADSECDNSIYCDGEEKCVNNICVSGQSPCAADKSCKEEARECWDVATITAKSLLKQLSKPLIRANKNQWLIVYCSTDNHFDKQGSKIATVGSGNGYQGVSVNTQKKMFSMGKFIFIPLSISKEATSGNWRIIIFTELPGFKLEERIMADFQVR